MTIDKFLYKNRSFAMNTFLKNSFIRHFDVRGVKMGQGQNVSFSFSNDGCRERAATCYNIFNAMAAQASASARAWWWRVKS